MCCICVYICSKATVCVYNASFSYKDLQLVKSKILNPTILFVFQLRVDLKQQKNEMASLMRPLLSRTLIMTTGLRSSAIVRGLASQQPPSKSDDDLNKPIPKKAVDPTADPKEACNF